MIPIPQQKRAAGPSLTAALRGEVTPEVPFWLMRQAGRYLPEYRSLRQKAGSFLDLCFNPELAAEATLQPLRRFGMDAAILFSDILVIPYALGQELSFTEGEGPKLGPLHRDRLFFDAQKLAPVYDALARVRKDLPPDKAVIGFAGAPWTLACYMVQGGGDGVFAKALDFAESNPAEFGRLIDALTQAVTEHLSAQIRHGADAVQIFDSWAGLLPESGFMRWIVKPTRDITQALKKRHPHVPVIGFPRGAAALYARYAAETGVAALGFDQNVDPAALARQVGGGICLQGNLDPALLLAGGRPMREGVVRILSVLRERPFVFNLGHGVIKETPPEHVAELAEIIRSFQR